MSQANSSPVYDVVLVGGGIMSATLGTLLKIVEPSWSIALYETLNQAGQESSDPWNNAGTGHAALCELNYAPQQKDGSVDITKAININEQYHVTEQFWSYLVREGVLQDPESFLHRLPHMSFVWGNDHVNYLKTRFDTMREHPLFNTIEYSEDHDQIRDWAPLLIDGRHGNERLAASRIETGTDVDFGSLTRQLVAWLQDNGVEVHYGHQVKNVERSSNGRWDVKVKDKIGGSTFTASAKFLFLGAGGGALPLLQASGIPESKGFGGFPVSGKFMRCTAQNVISQHNAKVYGQAAVGAPPMSVPHLDTRFVDGRRSLMFGPYAGFSPNFLKNGSFLDLPLSVRPHNIWPMLNVAKDNVDLMTYLGSELVKSDEKKFESLLEFFPEAEFGDWEMITAGQRVQVMKKDEKKGGVLQFGTELVTSADGSIGALLGASPGASTAAPIMFKLLEKCFPQQAPSWRSKFEDIVPSYGHKLSENPELLEQVVDETATTLKLNEA